MADITIASKEIPDVLQLAEQLIPGLDLSVIKKTVTGVHFDLSGKITKPIVGSADTVTLNVKITP